MKILSFLKCFFIDHEPSEEDEDNVFKNPLNTKLYVDCIRCGQPLILSRESDLKEDEYYMQNDH